MKRILIGALLTMLFAYPATAQWNIQTVDNSEDTGTWSTVTYDSNGYPHIVYHTNGTMDAVMYAHWPGDGGWTIERIEQSASNIGDWGCTVDLDPNDVPHVAYTRQYYYSSWLQYATKDQDGLWIIESVETSGICHYPSIKVGIDEFWQEPVPHISYEKDGDLWHAYLDPETDEWVRQSVDAAGNVGQWNAIALDETGQIHISYYDAADRDLKYAMSDNNGQTWNSFIVDGLTSDVGSYSSIVVDASGVPHITYYDETNKDLKHASIVLDPPFNDNDEGQGLGR